VTVRVSDRVLTVDVGTSGCRAAVFPFGGAAPSASAVRTWTIRADPRYSGSLDVDLDATWAAIAGAIAECFDTAGAGDVRGSVAAVAVGSFRGGIVLMDERGAGLWACGAVDARASAQVRAIVEADSGYPERAYHRTGQTPAMGALPRLLWVREHAPEVFERTATVGMVADWVLAQLTGERCSTPSNACTTGLLSLADRDWAPDLFGSWDIPASLFPPVVEAGTVVGSVGAGAAAATGLASGTPAVAAGGDASLAAIGLGATAASRGAIVGGSFWQQLVNLDRPVTDGGRRVRVNCHAMRDMWQADALVFEAGIAHRWFVDAFGAGESFASLDARAASVPPGSNGTLAILSNAMDYGRWRHAAPSFLGVPYRDPDAVAVLYRALLEATALAARANLELIEAAFGVRPAEVLFGGGAARSGTWTRILAGVLGRPVVVPETAAPTSLGTAACAAVGAGAFPDVTAARAAIDVPTRVVEPDAGTAGPYDDLMGRWTAAYDHELELVRDGVVRPMWRAPWQGDEGAGEGDER
jgi:autoinducer 2 (AI-2) kinase